VLVPDWVDAVDKRPGERRWLALTIEGRRSLQIRLLAVATARGCQLN
jgi:hypothetical protein